MRVNHAKSFGLASKAEKLPTSDECELRNAGRVSTDARARCPVGQVVRRRSAYLPPHAPQRATCPGTPRAPGRQGHRSRPQILLRPSVKQAVGAVKKQCGLA